MRINTLFILMFLPGLFSCKEVANFLDPGQDPVINELLVNRNNVYPGDTVIANVSAVNPESGSLTYEWWSTGGTIFRHAESEAVSWIAPYSGGNTYSIHVKVSNSHGSDEDSREITVKNLDKPRINILSPKPDAYFILFQKIDVGVSAIATLPEKIDWVKLYVVMGNGDKLIDSTGYNNTGNYGFSFHSDEEMVGARTLKTVARASNGQTEFDQVLIQIEGVIPGGARQE